MLIIGADEVACDDIYNALDWNIDSIVGLWDLIILANARLVIVASLEEMLEEFEETL